MVFNVGDAVREGFDSAATGAGAVVALGLIVVGSVQNVATHDVLRAFFEATREPVLEVVREQDPEQAEEIAAAFDEVLASLSLAMEIPGWIALALWLACLLATAAVVVVGVEAFANDRDRIRGVHVAGFGRKTGRLALGWLVVVVAAIVGFFFYVIPGAIVAVLAFFLFFYFPAAIALEDAGLLASWRRSVRTVRANATDSVLVALVVVLVVLGANLVGGFLAAPLPAVPAALARHAVGSIGTVLALGVLTRAFLLARTRPEAPGETDGPGPGEVAPDPEADDEVHEDW